jgi:beta-glucanase (GH16 family)
MRTILLLSLIFHSTCGFSQLQTLSDTFEGDGTILSWYASDCGKDNYFANPYPTVNNNSATVLKYSDTGGPYAHIGFNGVGNFNLTNNSTFSVKIYVPSNSLTGNQNNQISLKLQNGSLAQPWLTQCEIIKPIILNQWQTITFNFATDPFVNFNPTSLNPMLRFDFNRVLIQINGENNNANVTAYLDDFLYTYTNPSSKFNTLVWADEFDENGVVNSTNWHHQTLLPNGDSWFSNEQQHYTNRDKNSYVSDGTLKIVAKKESFTNQGVTKQYTSARLNSKFAFKYGRVEVRAKLPTGKGTWPAIWMLGKNINELGAYWQLNGYGTVNWPACGEIDIMEHWGNNQDVVSSAVHHPINGNLTIDEYVANYQTKSGVSTQFHIYAVEWDDQRITFSVDGVNHLSYSPTIKNQYTWPFDAEQFLLLNVAIEPSVLSSNFTQSAMEIDYVRVYQENALSNPNEKNLDDLVLYPNPATATFTLKIGSKNQETQAKIYSILGQEMDTFILKEPLNTIDISGYQKGIYFIKVKNEKETKTFEIIKE